MTTLAYVCVVATAIASCAWDLRSRRIPNALTFGSAIAALVVHAYSGGPMAAAAGVAGWIVGLLLFLPWFAAGGMGAGDVKLLAAFGAWLGPVGIVWAALAAMLAGGVLALAVVILRGSLRETMTSVWLLAMAARVAGVRGLQPDRAPARSEGIAYAVPVAVGVGVTLWLR